MNLSARTTGTLMTVMSALGFSTLPIFGMIAYDAGATVSTLLGVRFLIAALILWAYVLLTRRTLPDLKSTLLLLLMGSAGYTTMSALYLSSVAADRLSPALAALLLYTYPAIVALMAWRFDGQHLSRRQVAALALTLAGLTLVLLVPGSQALFTVNGALLALGAAAVYSTYIFFGSRVSRQLSPIIVTTYVSTAAAVLFLGFGAVTGQLVPVAFAGWLAMVGTALFATVMAVMLFFAGIERLGPAQASMISTFEPVGTALLSALLFGDRLGGWQLTGGALVLAGILWLQAGAEA